MTSRNSNLSADVLINTGTIEGLDVVLIKCLSLQGTGLIKGPKITIEANQCEYEGTIECDGECVLKTITPKEDLKIKFVGKGQLTVEEKSKQ